MMKSTIFLCPLLIALLILPLPGKGQDRDLMVNSISKEQLSNMLLAKEEYKPLPFAGDEQWENLSPRTREQLVKRGERYLDYEWPSLPAITYMDYDINGNRSIYESMFFGRRNAVADLAIAEIIENKGRFTEDIINGIWLILEETTWVIPAHSGGDKLHDRNDVTVDLFSAETAALLAWVDYFTGEKLDAYTPLIRKRLYEEVDRRVITSMLEHDDFWYMGFTGRIPNNWNPWIVSNWLTAVLILEENRERRAASVWKSLVVLDNFLNPYPADGGCDEGPGYWDRAGASLFDCLQQLYTATGGGIDLFDDPLVRGMGQYIYKVHIHDQWFTNFADGSARLSLHGETIYRYGKAIRDQTMMAFGNYLCQLNAESEILPAKRADIGLRRLPDLLVAGEIAQSGLKYVPPAFSIFPDLQVVVARENESEKGFFTAIKGGFNNESHNHNDAGNFIVYYDGLPLLIDVGVETYTSKTFSRDRYSIWTMQSAYHNLPSLNGQMQSDGDQYRATQFTSENRNGYTRTTMQLEQAYPESAYTTSWQRTFELNRKQSEVLLTDAWEQERQENRNLWHFILAYEPKIEKEGLIKLTNGKTTLYLEYSDHFFPKIEKIGIDDPRLAGSWGDTLWRVTLTTGLKGLRGKEEFIIKTKKE